MKARKTTVILLGLALLSFNSFAEDTNAFSEFSGNFKQEVAVNEMMAQDNQFLSEVEEMQKNIRLMQLSLREKELRYQVEEQEKKLDNLLNPVEEKEVKCTDDKRSRAAVAPFMNNFAAPAVPVNNVIAAPVTTSSNVESKSKPDLYVSSIKGIKDDLKASVYSKDFGFSVISKGDVLNDGSKVKNITDSTVTLESAKGDINVIGIVRR